MRTKTRVALAALTACALTIGTAVPAGAQDEPEALGFAVDKTQAQPGTLVLGKAGAADVAEHCVTDLEEFQARFGELVVEAFGEGALSTPTGPLFEIFFPDQEEGEVPILGNHDQFAFALLIFVLVGIANNVDGAAEDALPQTFVMTFADIATQEPTGERGIFDPDTGEGSVVVPDIDPGLWAVAAACVGPSFDLGVLEAGIRAGGAFLQEIGFPEPEGVEEPLTEEIVAFMRDFLGTEETDPFTILFEFLSAIGPDLLEPIMVPDAFGAVIFCILDDQGNCPEPPPPPPELDEDDFEEPPPAPPVVAEPSFTG